MTLRTYQYWTADIFDDLENTAVSIRGIAEGEDPDDAISRLRLLPQISENIKITLRDQITKRMTISDPLNETPPEDEEEDPPLDDEFL